MSKVKWKRKSVYSSVLIALSSIPAWSPASWEKVYLVQMTNVPFKETYQTKFMDTVPWTRNIVIDIAGSCIMCCPPTLMKQLCTVWMYDVVSETSGWYSNKVADRRLLKVNAPVICAYSLSQIFDIFEARLDLILEADLLGATFT